MVFIKFSTIRHVRRWQWIMLIVAAILIFLVAIADIVYITLFSAPSLFPRGGVIAIDQGQSLSSIARTLQSNHLIRSTFWFTNAVLTLGREHGVQEGTYYFPQAENVFTVAWRLTHADYETEQIKTTVANDATVSDIAFTIKQNYPSFDTVHFLTLAQSKEGYLFPDTYYFGINPSAESIITAMNANFQRKISTASVTAALTTFGKPLAEVITMASIVEREALTTNDQRTVAGILWKRLAMGMPLDVDSTLYYLTGRSSVQLTRADLANPSPYNTYTHKGLPPTPIGNPSLNAIMNTLTPITTNYLYFLSGSDGTMHYATTLAGQHANEIKYLH